MKSRTKISWADFTLNPWEGCTKVSAGCRYCYAEARNNRYTGGANWGPGAPRRKSVSALTEVATINRRFGPQGDLMMMEVIETGERWINGKETPETSGASKIVKPQVFSLSLGDILDPEVDPAWLAEWMIAVGRATNLEFLLLTKRPELYYDRIAAALATIPMDHPGHHALTETAYKALPHIAWGTSVEDEKTNSRIDSLAAIPAARRFVSCEPLLGNPELWQRFTNHPWKIHLVISGGESGVQARPMHPAWIEAIERDCSAMEIPHHFKQWGTWAPAGMVSLDDNQRNPGNRLWFGTNGQIGMPANAESPGFPFVSMHRTPSKLHVAPLIGGSKIQQPRLTFPKP